MGPATREMLLVQMNILAELSTFQLESKATFLHCKEGASSQQMSLKKYLGHTHMEENWNLEKEMSLSARGEKLNLSRRLDSQRLTCCGTPLNPAMLNRTHNAKKHILSYPNSAKIQNGSNIFSRHTQTHLMGSPAHSGSASSKKRLATLISSICHTFS